MKRTLKHLILRALVAALVVFHVFLLFQRLADSTILEPAVLAKWLGAIALGGAALFVRRLAPQATGRRGLIVFWLLVFFLHVPAEQMDAELIAQFAIALAVVLIGLAPQTRETDCARARTLTIVPVRTVTARFLIPPRCPPLR